MMEPESTQELPEEETSQLSFEVVEGGTENGKPVRRGIYLLPNLFTTAALFCGFYTIIASINGLFEKAALALFLAMVLDGLDGRVARMTHTQSAFGAEYDSLSDLVAFGVAPALMMFSWSLAALGKVGWMAAFIFVACAALRLARFNTQIHPDSKSYFIGLPSPSAAAIVAGFVWAGFDMALDGGLLAVVSLLLTLFVAALMVSNIRYHSFKNLDLRGRVPFVTILAVIMIFVVVFIDPPKVLFLIFFGYALSGVFWYLKRRMNYRKSHKAY